MPLPRGNSLISPALGARLIDAAGKSERDVGRTRRRDQFRPQPHVGLARVTNGTPSSGRYEAVFLSTTDGISFTDLGECYLRALNGGALTDENEYPCLIIGVHTDGKPICVVMVGADGAESKPLEYFRHVSTTNYFTTPNVEITTNNSIITGVQYFTPFPELRGGTLDRIGIHVFSGVSDVRLGIYSATSDSDVHPDALVLDAGVVTLAGSGWAEITISQALDPNTLYWLSLMVDDSASSVYRIGAVNPAMSPLGFSTARQANLGLFASQAYGAMPDPAPSPFTEMPFALFLAVRYSA